MGAGSGVALKFLQWFIRGIEFGCAAVVLAIYSYFLAELHSHNFDTANWVRAVEGISGIAVLYTVIGLLLLCCLAGLTLTSFIAICLDVAFAGAFVYVAVVNHGGAGSCQGTVDTPFGSGPSDSSVSPNPDDNMLLFHTACKLETACFAVSLVAVFFFIFSALTEFALARHHNKEKRFGPGPQNNYTSGYGSKRGLFSFRRKKNTWGTQNTNALPEHTHPDQVRESYATETTRVGDDTLPIHSKYATTGLATDHPNSNYRYDDGVYNNSRAV